MIPHPYPDMPAPADEYLALVLDADLRLLAITERLRQHWSAHATALGLTAAQVKVLLRLTPGQAIPMRKLARQLGYDASNLTTVVDRLAARGALERQADPADRRVKALVLTPEGKRLRDQFWHNLVTDPGPLTPLRQGDLRTLTRLLAKLDQPAKGDLLRAPLSRQVTNLLPALQRRLGAPAWPATGPPGTGPTVRDISITRTRGHTSESGRTRTRS